MHKCNIITHWQGETRNVTVDDACGRETEGPLYAGSSRNDRLITNKWSGGILYALYPCATLLIKEN